MVTVENRQSLTVVYLLHLKAKVQAPALVDFTKQPTTESKIISPTNTARSWSKNRKVMVEVYAGVPDAVQSRRQKT